MHVSAPGYGSKCAAFGSQKDIMVQIHHLWASANAPIVQPSVIVLIDEVLPVVGDVDGLAHARVIVEVGAGPSR